jgi:hypothetical protein
MGARDETCGFFGTELFSIGQSHAVALRSGDGVWPLAPNDAQLLSHCRAFRTLPEHAAVLCRALGVDAQGAAELRNRLEKFAKDGHLVYRQALLDKAAGLPRADAPAKVARLCIPTRDRPEGLAECLETYLSNMTEHSHAADVLVADDSQDPDIQGRNRQVVSRAALRFGRRIAVAGPDAKKRYADLVSRRAGVHEGLAAFAWAGCAADKVAPGKNRNFLLAATAGRPFITVDDDTRCNLGRAPGADPRRIVFSTRSDPTEYWFFEDHDGASRALTSGPVDYVGGHEEFLGRGVLTGIGLQGFASVVLESPECFLRWLREGEGGIRVTQTGLYGDSGIGSPVPLLGLTGSTWQRLTASDRAYAVALRSRQVIRSVLSPVVSGGGYFMAYSIGLDNTQLLPPFSPVYRGEDEVFAMLLRKCADRDRIAHLPYTVSHRPPERRQFVTREDSWRDACAIRFNRLVGACVASAGSFPSWSAARRLEVAGRQLVDLGSLPKPDFKEFLRRMRWDSIGRWIGTLEGLLRQNSGVCPAWEQDVRAVLARYYSMIDSEELIRPVEFSGSAEPDEGVERLQNYVHEFGRLLLQWPALWEAARDLGESALRDALEP